MPLRGTEREESMGMDIVEHGEEAYLTGEGAILINPETEAASGGRPEARPALSGRR